MAATPKPVRKAIKHAVKKEHKIRKSSPWDKMIYSEQEMKKEPKKHAEQIKKHVKQGGHISVPKGHKAVMRKHTKEDLAEAAAHMKKHGG